MAVGNLPGEANDKVAVGPSRVGVEVHSRGDIPTEIDENNKLFRGHFKMGEKN